MNLMSVASKLSMVLAVILLSACADVPIYKRGALAKPEMAWEPDPLEGAIKKHVYYSKEAASGGAEAAGGGCGCN